MTSFRRTISKTVSFMLSAAIVCATVFGAAFFMAERAYAKDATVKGYEDQISDLEEKQKDLKNKINANKNESGKAAETKAYLDELIYTLEQKINASEALIGELERSIAVSEQEIIDCEAAIETYSEKITLRIRMMQEDNGAGYLGMIFGVTSISDFFSRLEHIKTMIDYDKKLKAEYKDQKQQLHDKKNSLEASMVLQNETLQTLSADKAEAKALAEKANRYIEQLAADEQAYKAELEKAEKAEAELDKKLTEYLKSLQNQNSSQVVADGEYLWPLPKGQGWITCKFGGSDPNNKPHYALDVAIAAGTPIYATNAGTVLISGWHSSYGYYILIEHGNGMASLYAHCSALLVKAGQTVSRGQTIGKVGTTGFSKGNHLHFEIRKNGVRVDPLAYMAPQAPENIL